MKTTMIRDESIPLVQASLLAIDTEPYRSNRSECVVIDAFDNVYISDPDLVSEEPRNSIFSQLASVAQNINPMDSNSDHEHPQDSYIIYQAEEFSSTDNFRCSRVNESKIYGAWVGGTVLGFLLGAGPTLSMAFGIWAAYCSQKENGVAGDIARAICDIAVLSHMKFVEVNEKHNLTENLANSTIAFSRNFLMVVSSYVDSAFSIVDEKNRKPMRQMSILDLKTT